MWISQHTVEVGVIGDQISSEGEKTAATDPFMMEDTSKFRVPEPVKKEHPTAEQVEANKAKWGVT